MDQAKREQMLRRGMISQGEYDEAVYFNPENIELRINFASDSTDISHFALDILICNLLDRPLHCALIKNNSPCHRNHLLPGLRFIDDTENETAVGFNTTTFAKPRAIPGFEHAVIPPKDCLTYSIQGIVVDNSLRFGDREIPLQSGMEYQVLYKYVGLISNTLLWIMPSMK